MIFMALSLIPLSRCACQARPTHSGHKCWRPSVCEGQYTPFWSERQRHRSIPVHSAGKHTHTHTHTLGFGVWAIFVRSLLVSKGRDVCSLTPDPQCG